MLKQRKVFASNVVSTRSGRFIGSHAAQYTLVEPTFGEVTESIDATIAKEGPVSPHVMALFEVTIRDQHGFVGRVRFGDQRTVGRSDKRLAPELQFRFNADTIRCSEPQTVRNRMRRIIVCQA